MSMEFIKHVNEWYWGKSMTIVMDNGLAFVTINLYDDEPKYANISGLTVHKIIRHHGYGTIMLKEAEQEIKKLGYNTIYLACQKDSWIEEWYKRKGYVNCGDDPNGDGYLSLMKKSLT